MASYTPKPKREPRPVPEFGAPPPVADSFGAFSRPSRKGGGLLSRLRPQQATPRAGVAPPMPAGSRQSPAAGGAPIIVIPWTGPRASPTPSPAPIPVPPKVTAQAVPSMPGAVCGPKG